MPLPYAIFSISTLTATESRKTSSARTSTLSRFLRPTTTRAKAISSLDATPLRHFLNKHLDCDRIQENIKREDLYALAISATNYNSGKSYLFIQGRKGHPLWKRIRLVTVATKMTVDHVCASSAIPMVFQPVKLKTPRGSAFFGDGCVRLQQPLSPVIR